MNSPLRFRIVFTLLALTLLAAAVWFGPQFAGAASASRVSPDRIWQSMDSIPAAPANASVEIKARKFKAFTVDRGQLGAIISQAPIEFTTAATQSAPTEITLPKPDGSFMRFRIEEVALMEPELAAKFPDIKTYRGRGIEDPLSVLHLDVNERTLHAQVLSPSGAWYIDPYWHLDGSLYMSYRKQDLLAGEREFRCLVDHPEGDPHTSDASDAPAVQQNAVPQNTSTGTMLRTYRIAFATSALYSNFHGGPSMEVPKILAAIVTLNNRVSGVYETELGIRMILVANQQAIIATTTNPTPYSDTPGDIGTNPAYLDQKIGEANYDIGHVVTTGSGGIAGLGVVCRGFNPFSGGSAKARGTTGTNPPVGDAFWIDFVAHEIGHQFGGNHTFDGTGTNCGTNQNEETAYEPGSGTTIQAYAGICGNQDIQPNSDPFFHFASLQEMFGYASSGSGARPTVVVDRSPATGGRQGDEPNANPSSGTLNSTGPDITWKGTASGGAASDESTCVEGVTCDTFTLTLSGEPGDWKNKNARITFTWPSPVDDYDVFVHKGGPDGPVVDDSASSNNPEVINIDPAARDVGTGVFTVRVVYFAVVPPAQQYTAVATAVDTSNPGAAPTCAVLTPTGNIPPTAEAGPNFKIPGRTPFTLTASNASDANGDPITYCWEEADLGAGPKDANLPDDGKNPLFRSFVPKLNPSRTFPRLQYVLNNANNPPGTYPCPTEDRPNKMCVTGEKLPTTNRELNFNLTVRDNVFGGWSMDTMKLDVLDSGAGFAVTSPNTAVTLPGGSSQTITWDVANTTGPEINTTNVNILLTTDAAVGPEGQDPVFTVLLANTPNDGSEVVTLPSVNTAKARIMVQSVGNVFFDISDVDFAITGPDASPTPTASPTATVSPSPTATPNPTATVSPTPTASPTVSPTPSPSASPTPSATATPSPTASPTPPQSTLLNISTRTRVQTGDNVMIGGFIITGSAPKNIVLRAIGPSLSNDGTPVAGRLEDTTLELLDQNGAPIAFNDNWRDDGDQRREVQRQNLQPGDDRESAIAMTLNPGFYTAVLRGKDNATGIALVEAYDTNRAANSKLANISTRGFVENGDNVMIGGFIVGDQGDGLRVVARAIGPSLKAQLPQALNDPILELKDQNGTTVRANDNWKDSADREEIERVGLAPKEEAESALVMSLSPAPHTVIVGGQGGTGVALVEVFQIRNPASSSATP